MKIDFTETEKLIGDGFDPQEISTKLKSAVLRATVYDTADEANDLIKNTLFACDLIESIKVEE